MKKRFLFTTLLLAYVFIFAACYTPSPLYGTWTDNDGNKITFRDDSTFNATIRNTDSTLTTYEGTWSAIDNVLVLVIKGDTDSYSRNTEWDLQGARLSLTWTANGTTKILTLWHTSRSQDFYEKAFYTF